MSCNHPSPPRPGISYRFMQALMGPFMKLAGLSCRHFAELCSAELDRPLTRGERFRYRCHSMMCRVCRPLPRQFAALSALTHCCVDDSTAGEPDHKPEKLLDEAARERIERSIQAAVTKGDDFS